jgi:hypothetical protein
MADHDAVLWDSGLWGEALSHHTQEPVCPLCEEKLAQAHPVLANWFRTKLKPKHPEAHISWSFRDEANQEEAFKEGKTRCRWPNSQHNKLKDGKPYSRALDLFELTKGGVARFQIPWFKAIADELEHGGPIIWGYQAVGKWDSDHFQLERDIPQ